MLIEVLLVLLARHFFTLSGVQTQTLPLLYYLLYFFVCFCPFPNLLEVPGIEKHNSNALTLKKTKMKKYTAKFSYKFSEHFANNYLFKVNNRNTR